MNVPLVTPQTINVSSVTCYHTPRIVLREEPASGAPDGFAVMYQHTHIFKVISPLHVSFKLYKGKRGNKSKKHGTESRQI
jgi:hypothetical protein